MKKKSSMTEVIPAILAKDINDLRQKIANVVNVAHIVQIDICDGKFVESKSWPMDRNDAESVALILDEEEGLPYWENLDFEFDLMVKDAIKQFDFFVRLGAKRIIFHLEAEDKNELKDFINSIDPYTRENLEIGIAINTTTPIEELYPFINSIDFIQCMGIEHIGFQGELFDEKVLIQIKGLKERYPDLIISVDGSVNEDTAPLLVEAGANRLIVGSVLMRSYDVKETIKELENL
jgi:ribulose-phosphate 3-epimerase